MREHGITLLNENDPLAQRVYLLAARLGLRTRPWVGTMPHNNAYAIGSNADNAMVVVGQPLLDTLSEAEVDAIIGHELGHIANNDMRRMGLARSFQNALVWYLGFSETLQRWGRWLLTWISELYVLRLSRKREYWADAFGAALTSKEHMIAALDKLHNGPDLSDFERKEARLMVRGIAAGSLLSTHPTLEERRAALEAETYLAQIPALKNHDALSAPHILPKVEDIAYASH
ncbi:M48 family metalloprotease [Agrobacterium radiobacter]|uniref:M48 family metalloprotease n=1 Tax=Agrobacterium tumefaciens complex TaxID=1183400 RepID=UPI001EEEEE57|nr:M48 family metalloprotease [Agrobacterium tumefaciens]